MNWNSEVRQDREYREYTGEFSKFPEWDKMQNNKYTEEDRRIDCVIEEDYEGKDCK